MKVDDNKVYPQSPNNKFIVTYYPDMPDNDPAIFMTEFGGRIYVFHQNSIWASPKPRLFWHRRLWRWVIRLWRRGQ